jgi:DNA polymerase kappa
MAEEKEGWKDYQSVFTAAKAGMEGVDKEKVKKVVYEMSKVSRLK